MSQETPRPRRKKRTNVRTVKLAVAAAGLRLASRLSTRMAAAWAESLFFTPPRARARTGELPAGAQRIELAGERGTLVAWSWGTGPAVYLVHGWGGRGEQLAAFVEPLFALGFRAVAFDGPGHGDSEGRFSSGPELARALVEVSRRFGPPHAVIAHSLGAAAAVYAIRIEGLRPQRLVFIGAPANPLEWVTLFAGRLGLGPDVVEEMRRRSEARIRARWDDLPVVPLREGDDMPPLLVVHDRDDREVAWSEGVAVAAEWPGARRMDTAGLGHNRILRDAQVVAEAAAFVAEAGTGPAVLAAESCAHGQVAASCEGCALEGELFVPASRARRAGAWA